VIEIGILRSIRQMLERNSTLQYFSISGIYKFNQHAILALIDSLCLNTGLKLIDLKKTSKEFLRSMEEGVNTFRHPDRKIVFMHE